MTSRSTTAGVRRLVRRAVVAAAAVAATATLVPLAAATPAGAATAGVDVAASTLSGIKAATADPDGDGLFVALGATSSTAPATVSAISTSSTARTLQLSSPAAPSLIAASRTGSGDAAVLVIKGAPTASSWSADLFTSWAAGVSSRRSVTVAGGPVAAVAGNGYAYVELNDGSIDSVDLSTGVVSTAAAVPNATLVGSGAAQRGVLAIDPSGSRLYVGTDAGGIGAVQEIVLNNASGSLGAAMTLGADPTHSMLPTAVYADGTNVYAAGSAGLTVASAGALPSTVGIAAYPVAGMGCGSLGTDRVVGQLYLDCTPVAGSTDVHLYRFKVPSDLSLGLREAAGVPLTKVASGVWGAATGGVYLLENGTAGYVSSSSLSTQPALKTYPQPPSNVVAAPISTTVDGSTSAGWGIWVSWNRPQIGAADVTGYTVAAKPSSGASSYCSSLTATAAGGECLIPGLVPGQAYTISVQSTNSAGASAASLAPYRVNAGTPGPTISNPVPSGCATGSASIVVPTYTVAKAVGTAASPAVTVSWPAISDASCDPFTHKTITMGAHPVTYYVLSAIDTATNTVAKTTNVPVSTVASATAPGSSLPEYQGTLTGLTPGKSYVFTVAANSSFGTLGTNGLPAFAAAWTGTATYAVPDTYATSTTGAKVMDPTPASVATPSTGTYVPGGAAPAAYASQAALYDSAYYGGLTPIDPSLVAGSPTAPYDVEATTTSGTIAVDWQAQPNYSDHLGWGLQDVVGYTATASYTDPTGKTTAKTCTTSGYRVTSCTITGLTNGNKYAVSVQAKGGTLGPAAYVSDPDGSRRLIMPAGLPGAPTAITVSVPQISPNAASQQWGTATVRWTPPADNGGLPITGYQVVAIPADPTIANTLSEYLCNPADGDAKGLIDAQVAATPSLEAPVTVTTGGTYAPLPISATAVDASHLFPRRCETNPWGTNSYSFPVGTLSSQTGWTFKVAAHNAYEDDASTTASWGALSTASSKVTPTGAPMAPTKVTATVSATAITASWTAPTVLGGWALKGYQANLYRYDSVGTATQVGTCTASSAMHTCSVPTASHAPDGSSYFFTVQAYNNGQGQPGTAGALPASNESAVSNTLAWYARPPVLRVTAATPADKSIAVSWDANPPSGSLDSSNSPITLYTASATAGTTTKTCTAVPPATSCIITGLVDGTAYTVGVTEANPGVTSLAGYWKDPKDLSSAATTLVSPGTVPDAPTAISVHPGNQAVDVWWTAPKNTGGVRIDYYTVSIVPGGAQCPEVDGSGPLTCHIDGLTNGIDYTATVTSHNWFGTSVASTPSAAFRPYGLSQPPLDVQAFPQDRSAAITWEAPADDGGATITGYEAVARPIKPGAGALRSCKSMAPTSTTGTGTKTVTTVTGPAPLTCTITGLTNAAQYTVDVVAVNAAGTSGRSAPTAPFLPIGAPDAPTGVFAYTDIGGSTSGGPTTLHVAWNPSQNDGGSTIVRYIAKASNGAACVAESGLTACDIEGLRAGVKYTVTVTATNLDGFVSKPSAASPPSVPAGPPTAPSDVLATGAQNAIMVSWKPSHGNGAAITQYVITVQPTGQVVVVSGNRTSAVISHLDAALSYQVTVQAQSGPVLVSGLSKKSGWAKPYNTPNRIARPVAKAVKTRHGYKVLVGWKAPAVGGAPVTGYIVRHSGRGAARTVGAGTHRVTFTGMKANHRYSFTVTPVNRYGNGLPSVPVVVKTRG